MEHPWSGNQYTFSAFAIAERMKVPPGEFRARLPELERELLAEFYRFVSARPGAWWVHWGMRGLSFGFDALAQRAQVHGLDPVHIPPDRRFDLSSYLKLRYGAEYAPHPRLDNAIRRNLGAVPGLLTEQEAAAAWGRGDYAAILWSLVAKVSAIANLLDRVRQGKFLIGPPHGGGGEGASTDSVARGADQAGTGAGAARKKGKDIEARMLKVLSDTPEAIGWPIREWAERLDCSPATVAATKTWKERIKAARALAAAERLGSSDRQGDRRADRRALGGACRAREKTRRPPTGRLSWWKPARCVSVWGSDFERAREG